MNDWAAIAEPIIRRTLAGLGRSSLTPGLIDGALTIEWLKLAPPSREIDAARTAWQSTCQRVLAEVWPRWYSNKPKNADTPEPDLFS